MVNQVYKRAVSRTKKRPYSGYCQIRRNQVDARAVMNERFEVEISIGGSFICPDCKGTSGHSVTPDETGRAECMCGSVFDQVDE